MAMQDWLDAGEQDDPIFPKGAHAGKHMSDPSIPNDYLAWMFNDDKAGWKPPEPFHGKGKAELARRTALASPDTPPTPTGDEIPF